MTYALHQVMYDYQRSGIVSILLFVREADRPVRLRPIDSETRPRGGAPAPNSRSGETQLQVQAASVAHSRLPDFASEDSFRPGRYRAGRCRWRWHPSLALPLRANR